MGGEQEARTTRWWLRLLSFFRAPEGVTAAHRRMLAVLGSAYVVNSYDLGILNLALPQIQEGLRISEADVAFTTGLVRFGVLPALALNVMADRIGRRRLLLVTIVGFTVCTFVTAFVRTPAEFVVAQFLARMFIYSEEMLAIVVVTEELPARARGWGIGILVALGAVGHGLAALMFAGVDVFPYGWRALYFVGAVPLLMLIWLRRNLQETRRFQEYRAGFAADRATGFYAATEPLRHLISMYPGRMAVLAAAYFPFSYFVGTALAFQSKFLQQSHAYTPGDVSFLFLVGGLLAIAGGLLGGRASDRFGRRKVLVAALLANFVAFAAFYNGTGAALVSGWILSVFTYFAVDALFAALGSELFPTSYRSTASGMRGIVGAVGSACGLLTEGSLFVWLGSHAAAITTMSTVLLLSPVVVLFLMPETATRELEEIAPEKA